MYMRVVAPVGILDHTQKLFCQLPETVLLLPTATLTATSTEAHT